MTQDPWQKSMLHFRHCIQKLPSFRAGRAEFEAGFSAAMMYAPAPDSEQTRINLAARIAQDIPGLGGNLFMTSDVRLCLLEILAKAPKGSQKQAIFLALSDIDPSDAYSLWREEQEQKVIANLVRDLPLLQWARAWPSLPLQARLDVVKKVADVYVQSCGLSNEVSVSKDIQVGSAMEVDRNDQDPCIYVSTDYIGKASFSGLMKSVFHESQHLVQLSGLVPEEFNESLFIKWNMENHIGPNDVGQKEYLRQFVEQDAVSASEDVLLGVVMALRSRVKPPAPTPKGPAST